MGKMNGFVCFTLMLLVGMSGPASAIAREHASTIPWENESTEALCFPTENGKRKTECRVRHSLRRRGRI